MKIQSSEGLARIRHTERSPQRDPDIDTISTEIFAQLNAKNFDATALDPERYLKRAASSLLRQFDPKPHAIRASLNAFPQNQREALLLHLNGLTCSQIAQRQGKSTRAVLKTLSRAYARIRMELNPM